jgi:hypothetical protein
MTHKSVMFDGVGRRVLRDDAIKHSGRYYVPTTDQTKWVSNWTEFLEAGGNVCFSEDQTEIELLLPEPYKFGIRFQEGA